MTDDNQADQTVIVTPEDLETGRLPARLDETFPDKLLLIALQARPYFPAQTMPLVIDEELWRETIERVGSTPQHLVGLVLARPERDALPQPADFAEVGTLVRMHHAVQGQNRIQFIAEGLQRFRITRWIATEKPYVVQVEYPKQGPDDSREVRAYALAIINKIKELLPLNPLYKENVRAFLERFSPDEASPLADFAAALTSANADQLQEVLEAVPLLRRMEKVMLLVQNELEVAGLQTEIRRKVEERMSEHQREFFLKEQLKEIQKELGISKDDKTVEVERFKERLENCEVPVEAQKRIDDELQKFAFLQVGSPEYSVTRNYLDTLTALPWGKYSEDHLDLGRARAQLDADHEGLDDVKERIIEFIGVGALRGEIAGSILLLVGPPGVGKTSVGHSIAAALGREFYRFSVGGMRDEAEIKGHRRTYIGAMPGKFIQAIRDAGTANPVIMLDEIDKIGNSYHGDPASALLEVLDPEQNVGFLDHYLDVRFDLSKVLFVCTANQLDTIPRALLDRMEVIRLPGYIAAEKLAIAKKHLWPKRRTAAGLRANQLSVSDGAIKRIIEGYAREAGVRSLEKQLGKITRRAAVTLVEGKQKRVSVTLDNLETFLGPPVFRKQTPQRGVGVVTGLAWTALGGATLDVEATRVHNNNRGLKLTGQLGEVMRESAEIAYSYVCAHLDQYDGEPGFFDKAFVHLHVPEGATPKDGPSAGITMATALLSLARNRGLRRPLAMTGELTLTGRVLPVGGIREKMVAARRNNIKEVILPEACSSDYEQLPDHVKKGLEVHFVVHYSDVVDLAFG